MTVNRFQILKALGANPEELTEPRRFNLKGSLTKVKAIKDRLCSGNPCGVVESQAIEAGR